MYTPKSLTDGLSSVASLLVTTDVLSLIASVLVTTDVLSSVASLLDDDWDWRCLKNCYWNGPFQYNVTGSTHYGR